MYLVLHHFSPSDPYTSPDYSRHNDTNGSSPCYRFLPCPAGSDYIVLPPRLSVLSGCTLPTQGLCSTSGLFWDPGSVPVARLPYASRAYRVFYSRFGCSVLHLKKLAYLLPLPIPSLYGRARLTGGRAFRLYGRVVLMQALHARPYRCNPSRAYINVSKLPATIV